MKLDRMLACSNLNVSMTMTTGGSNKKEEIAALPVLCVSAPPKNVTFAVNYELPMVNQFVHTRKRRRRRRSNASTTTESLDPVSEEPEDVVPEDEATKVVETPGRRTSARDKNKKTPVTRSRTKYDMELVPAVQKNNLFLDAFDVWWKRPSETDPDNNIHLPPTRKSSRSSTHPRSIDDIEPFLLDPPSSTSDIVIWIPESREQWEDTISEMTAVCTSAAIRRHDFHSKKPFIPPLSRDYIRDRIDIDDPLFGYQIRHRNGWLQGFVLFTNFTTWTYGFHWDSMHEMAMQPSERSNKNDGTVDQDGSLARELEAQHRSGDPKREGIVFQNIAEIALLGGLGCGEYLLRMALEQMRAKGFHYVVLQATNTSKSFYEKFGFVRVGAICRYGQPQPGQTELDLPIQGYRHWTHANESEKSLEKHGGPSYMMCLKFPPQADDENTNTGTPFCDAMLRKLLVNTKPKVEPLGATTPGLRRANSMPIQMSSSCETAASVPSLEISGNHSNKWTPKTAEQKLKSNSTLRRQSSMSPYISVPPPTAVAGIIRRKSSSSFLNTTDEQKATNKLAVSKTRANNKRFSEEAYDGRNAKRRKIEPKAASSTIPPPPKDGKPLSYVEKQYHSVWLAVPPVTTNVTHSRPPPKPRGEEALSVKRNLRSLPPSVKIVAPKFPTTSVSQGSPKSSMKHPASLSKSTMVDSTGRIYYAVRGSDGKFQSSSGKKSISKSHKKKVNPEPVSPQKTNDTVVRSETPYVDLSLLMNNKRRKPKPIDKSTLRKQKVKSYPRDKLHYFNRVVRRKDSNENSTKEYFFVLHFDDVHDLLLIVPMAATGTLLGKRQGRPRYQCVIGDTDANFETVHASDYEVIRSAMIMKTPLICQEAWDIEEDEDVDFCTR